MASTTFCDWCGELMEVPPGSQPLELFARGHTGSEGDSLRDFFIHHSLAGEFHIHAEKVRGGGLDPDCCLAQLETLLRERAAWAHDPDKDSLEWRLVARKGRIQTAGEKHRAIEMNARQQFEQAEDERDEAYARWRAFPHEERAAVVMRLLSEEPATVGELASRMEDALPEMGSFFDSTVRPIVSKLFKAGKLDREGEKFRAGDGPGSTRYRYFIADDAEAVAA